MHKSTALHFVLGGVAVPFLACAGVFFAGCGTAPTTSSVQGVIDQASFPSAVSKLTVTKSDGTSRSVTVDRLGNFTISLDPSATYHVFLGADGKSIPLSLRGMTAGLGERLTISSAGASLDLGKVRYWHGNSVTPYSLTLGRGLPTTTNQCTSGVLPSGQPCATESASVQCGDSDEDHDKHGHGGHGCMGGHDHESDVGADHEHASDGAASSDGDDAVDESAPFAVAGLNVPGSIGCADDEDHDHHHEGDQDSDHHGGDD